MSKTWVCVAALALTSFACGDDEGNAASGGGGGTGASGGGSVVEALAVSGSIVDFGDGAPIGTSGTVSVSGLNPAPTITVTGADFTISGVAPFSVFQILSGAPPDYRNTYNIATEVEDADVSGVEASVVSEAFVADLQNELGVTPAAGTGIVLGRVIDDAGMPRAGIDGGVFQLNDADPPTGPHFLDAQKVPDAALGETSGSGWVVFFDVPAGLVSFSAAAGSGYTVVAAQSPVAANVVTLADITVSDGELMLPTNVSFGGDVVPIFAKRGCEVCHSGNSIGADLGDLALNGGNSKIHRELTEEISPNYDKTRVDLVEPANSLLLTMPSLEDPPDAHPNATFASPTDPDYLILLGWITEGAKLN